MEQEKVKVEIPERPLGTCPQCLGQRKVIQAVAQHGINGNVTISKKTCPTCSGSGLVKPGTKRWWPNE